MRMPRERSFLTPLLTALLVMLVGCGASPVGTLPDIPASLETLAGADSSVAEADDSWRGTTDDCRMLGEPSSETHQALFDALNEFRLSNGLEPLIYSRTLEIAADAQTHDLYERSFFAHINPDGQNPGQRALEAGFCHAYVGENIAAGQKTVEAAQQAWENSTSHRENMLLPAYRYVGVGYYQDPNGRRYWAQEMAYDLP